MLHVHVKAQYSISLLQCSTSEHNKHVLLCDDALIIHEMLNKSYSTRQNMLYVCMVRARATAFVSRRMQILHM